METESESDGIELDDNVREIKVEETKVKKRERPLRRGREEKRRLFFAYRIWKK